MRCDFHDDSASALDFPKKLLCCYYVVKRNALQQAGLALCAQVLPCWIPSANSSPTPRTTHPQVHAIKNILLIFFCSQADYVDSQGLRPLGLQ